MVVADGAAAHFTHSSGKNTVPDAIAYCVGDSLSSTPAIFHESVGSTDHIHEL
jgi:hypothetical protein